MQKTVNVSFCIERANLHKEVECRLSICINFTIMLHSDHRHRRVWNLVSDYRLKHACSPDKFYTNTGMSSTLQKLRRLSICINFTIMLHSDHRHRRVWNLVSNYRLKHACSPDKFYTNTWMSSTLQKLKRLSICINFTIMLHSDQRHRRVWNLVSNYRLKHNRSPVEFYTNTWMSSTLQKLRRLSICINFTIMLHSDHRHRRVWNLVSNYRLKHACSPDKFYTYTWMSSTLQKLRRLSICIDYTSCCIAITATAWSEIWCQIIGLACSLPC